MTARLTPGARLRAALDEERPLQIVGAINAYAALLAQRSGFRALYLSGSGVAGVSLGLPDLGITNLADICEDARRITSATDLPLLVDADTGFGTALGIARTVRELERAETAGLHIEDQVQTKRCGHRPGKTLVSIEEMNDRIKAAVDARRDARFVVMARTDATTVEGVEAAVARAARYVEAGADMVFAEALTTLDACRAFASAVPAPVLVNVTEFGHTPLLTAKELADAGVRLALYPLSAFRAMSQAALRVYAAIREVGTQKDVIELMQPREELYEVLGYYEHERRLDELSGKTPSDGDGD